MNAVEKIRAESKRRVRLAKRVQRFAAELSYELDLGTPEGSAYIECLRDLEDRITAVPLAPLPPDAPPLVSLSISAEPE